MLLEDFLIVKKKKRMADHAAGYSNNGNNTILDFFNFVKWFFLALRNIIINT